MPDAGVLLAVLDAAGSTPDGEDVVDATVLAALVALAEAALAVRW
jgi:hypothetical protein